jgi:membrane protease YdiL (CAAX protease family)
MALLVGLPKDWKSEAKQGLLYAVLFIMANLILPKYTTIGIPAGLQSFSTDFIAVVCFAPLVEELLFRFLLLNALWAVRLSVWIAVPASAAIFMLFHYAAYGQSLTAGSASFIGALIFGIIVGIIAIRNRSFVTPMIIHATFNCWLLVKTYFR